MDTLSTTNGAVIYHTSVFPTIDDKLPEEVVPTLLAPAAFDVMKAAERYSHERGPLLVVTCHNPGCGKRFFSSRAGAVTCPRPPRHGRRSPCKSVWEAYRKWLAKVHPLDDPAMIWDRDTLKNAFLAQYRPHGRQAQFD